MCAEKTVVVDGFTVLQTKFQESSKPGHSLYVKELQKRAGTTRPKDRTLFVVNVPPYCTQESVKRVFSDFGEVIKVCLYNKPRNEDAQPNLSKYFQDAPEVKGFKVAYIVFKKASSIQKVKSHPYDNILNLSPEDAPIITGINKWQMDYENNVCNTQKLQTEIDKFMEAYDEEQEREKNLALEQEGMPDEEGWVKVTRHGKNKGAPRTETMERKVTAKDKRKQTEKELRNFYAFQMRESKRDSIAELRKKFEEDKQRISLMKASRKFRPY
ncbi:ribosomal RNA-processing protein 7 homolog A-like [Ostrea edulis]|uniref:ribosomal RNA-processing protein 7 homolog A-like n=1 Tax=Ostrea edulis TaxID=37623 RepID=UPI0024AF36B3|nr:ribosomal RNA-processing protein 7 homolog A-like [Ostrea edulis]